MGDEQILRKVRNNYQSRNLIGHYPFWVISPRNSTSFTRPFLARRRARAGHETKTKSKVGPKKKYAWPGVIGNLASPVYGTLTQNTLAILEPPSKIR